MYRLLCPNVIINKLEDIRSADLLEKGICGLAFDLDNTIIPWGSSQLGTVEADIIKNLIRQGFKICLISNNQNYRVKEIAAIFDIPFIAPAYKPFKSGFRRAAAIMELSPEKVAVVGDQLYTDILGGNRLGMFTIWVKQPLSSQEFLGTKITRKLEKLTVWFLKSKGLIK